MDAFVPSLSGPALFLFLLFARYQDMCSNHSLPPQCAGLTNWASRGALHGTLRVYLCTYLPRYSKMQSSFGEKKLLPNIDAIRFACPPSERTKFQEVTGGMMGGDYYTTRGLERVV